MTDLGKVQRGSPLAIKASTFNAFIDAAAAHQRSLHDQSSDPLRANARTGIVLVRNKTGEDLDQFAIAGLDKASIEPQDNEEEFRRRLVFDIKKPDEVDPDYADHEMRFVIMQQPLKQDAVGKGMILGVSPVKLDIKEERHDYASFKAGETAHLETNYVGTARILYKESGTGVKWGIVEMPVCDGPRILIVNKSGASIPEGGAMRVDSADADRPFVFNVKKPDKDHQLNIIPLVGPSLAANKERWIRFEPVMRFKVDDYDIEPGDFIGARDGSWSLEKTKFGFLVLAIQDSSDGTFAYCHFNGLTPVLKATSDESGGQIDVNLVDSGGSPDGQTFSLKVIPEGDGE